jgi:hypothetical protein
VPLPTAPVERPRVAAADALDDAVLDCDVEAVLAEDATVDCEEVEEVFADELPSPPVLASAELAVELLEEEPAERLTPADALTLEALAVEATIDPEVPEPFPPQATTKPRRMRNSHRLAALDPGLDRVSWVIGLSLRRRRGRASPRACRAR